MKKFTIVFAVSIAVFGWFQTGISMERKLIIEPGFYSYDVLLGQSIDLLESRQDEFQQQVGIYLTNIYMYMLFHKDKGIEGYCDVYESFLVVSSHEYINVKNEIHMKSLTGKIRAIKELYAKGHCSGRQRGAGPN